MNGDFMENDITTMLAKYNAADIDARKNALKEIMQEIVLCGLYRAGFFEKAAFYGGTALRIFYGLDRFSEDLDFSLLQPDSSFSLSDYFPILQKEAESYGLKIDISEKKKTRQSNILSAFVKGNTKEHLIVFYGNDSVFKGLSPHEMIKIKFEADINPPPYAGFEHKFRLMPTPYQVCLYDMPSLFAGKIHAVLCRSWKNRIKGRDLYDYVFYLSRGEVFNLRHLQARLAQSGIMPEGNEFTLDEIRKMLISRFSLIDYNNAKEDVSPFIKRTESLEIWNADFFSQITETLKAG